MFKIISIGLVVIWMAGPAMAQETAAAPTASSSPATAAPARSPLICKADAALGSRIVRRKICKTAADWEADHRETRNIVERGQSQRLSRTQ